MRELTSGQDHELLHGQAVAGVRAAIDDVEGGHGQNEATVASQVGDVTVQRHTLIIATRQT